MTAAAPRRAMVLAAGLGKRMRPVTAELPKPLVPVAGKPLIAHTLDRLAAAGITSVVVNSHYKAARLERGVAAYLAKHGALSLHLSREDVLLDTGGGVANVLDRLGPEPFFVVNSDIVLCDGPEPALARLAAAWRDAAMDALLLVCPRAQTKGYAGVGDYFLEPGGALRRRAGEPEAPHVFTGVQLLHPRLFEGAPSGAFSLLRLYDKAEARGRLAGLQHDDAWLHVGSPQGLAEAERYLSSTVSPTIGP